MRGSGEQVFQFEMNRRESPVEYMPITLANELTQGDLTIKFADQTLMQSTSNNDSSIKLSVGVNTATPTGLTLEIGRTSDSAQAKTGTFNNGSANTSFFPSALVAGVPRYIRIAWTSTAFHAKGWNYNEAEPATYAISVTSGISIGQGSVQLEVIQDSQLFNFHWCMYADGGAPRGNFSANEATVLPEGSNRNIVITPEKADGSKLLGVKSHLYHQSTGQKLGEVTTDSSSGVADFQEVVSEDVLYAVSIDPANTLDVIDNFLNKGA